MELNLFTYRNNLMVIILLIEEISQYRDERYEREIQDIE
jgi:hypothetical protein